MEHRGLHHFIFGVFEVSLEGQRLAELVLFQRQFLKNDIVSLHHSVFEFWLPVILLLEDVLVDLHTLAERGDFGLLPDLLAARLTSASGV